VLRRSQQDEPSPATVTCNAFEASVDASEGRKMRIATRSYCHLCLSIGVETQLQIATKLSDLEMKFLVSAFLWALFSVSAQAQLSGQMADLDFRSVNSPDMKPGDLGLLFGP
jgi:hypothetical protein